MVDVRLTLRAAGNDGSVRVALRVVPLKKPPLTIVRATVWVSASKGVRLHLHPTSATRPLALPKPDGPAQLSLRDLRKMDVMSAYPQVASDLFFWPPYKHRDRLTCSCPASNDMPIHRWPCPLASSAAGTARGYARSIESDEAATRRAAAKRAPAQSIPPPVVGQRSGWAKSDGLGSPRWTRPPCAKQLENAEATRQRGARRGGGAGVAADAPEQGAEGAPPLLTGEPAASPMKAHPPKAAQGASTSPRRKPAAPPATQPSPSTAPPKVRAHGTYQNVIRRVG